MSIFARIALRLHGAERFFAGLHERYWCWKHRNEIILTERRDTDQPTISKQIHDPEEQTRRNDGYIYEEITVAEARERDFGVCEHCFYGATVEPHPY